MSRQRLLPEIVLLVVLFVYASTAQAFSMCFSFGGGNRNNSGYPAFSPLPPAPLPGSSYFYPHWPGPGPAWQERRMPRHQGNTPGRLPDWKNPWEML